MLVNSNIDQAIIATQTVGVKDSIGGVHFSMDNGLQRDFRSVWDNSCVHAATALEQSEHDCFSPSSVTYFAANALRPD